MCREYVTFLCQSRAAESALIDWRFAELTEVWAQLHWSLRFCLLPQSVPFFPTHHLTKHLTLSPAFSLCPVSASSSICWWSDRCPAWASFCGLAIEMCGTRFKELLCYDKVLLRLITAKCWHHGSFVTVLRNRQWQSFSCSLPSLVHQQQYLKGSAVKVFLCVPDCHLSSYSHFITFTQLHMMLTANKCRTCSQCYFALH